MRKEKNERRKKNWRRKELKTKRKWAKKKAQNGREINKEKTEKRKRNEHRTERKTVEKKEEMRTKKGRERSKDKWNAQHLQREKAKNQSACIPYVPAHSRGFCQYGGQSDLLFTVNKPPALYLLLTNSSSPSKTIKCACGRARVITLSLPCGGRKGRMGGGRLLATRARRPPGRWGGGEPARGGSGFQNGGICSFFSLSFFICVCI